MSRQFINIGPFAYRRQRLLSRRARQWSLVWLATIGILGIDWWMKEPTSYSTERALDELRVRRAALVELDKQAGKLRQDINRMRGNESLLHRLDSEPSGTVLIGAASTSAARSDGNILIEQFVYERSEVPAPEQAARGPSPRPGTPGPARPGAAAAPVMLTKRKLGLKGSSAGPAAVAALVVNLREIGVFDQVELRSAVNSGAGDSSRTNFQLDCQF